MKLPNLTDKHQRTVWLRAFHIWQHRPHEVAPLSEETRVCASCSTEFRGNFCPRCGQSAGIGRFSFKKAALLFIDVWGLGNRGMFRSIRDLALRPGYMIRDYLRGMQSAYFPPFKMFFLLTALSLLVEHGFNLGLAEEEKQKAEQIATDEFAKDFAKDYAKDFVKNFGTEEQNIESDQVQEKHDYSDDFAIGSTDDPEQVEQTMRIYNTARTFASVMNSLRQKNPAVFGLLSLVLFSIPLYFFIRHSPTIPNLMFSEFVVALVYTANVYSIYSIAGKLLNSGLIKIIAVMMVFITFHQLTGFRKRRLLGYVLQTMLISSVTLFFLACIGTGITYCFS